MATKPPSSRPQKIIVTHVESLAIHKILKADKGDTPLEDFITKVETEAKIERWIAEKFCAAWRWNHRNDSSSESEEEQQPKESFFIKQDLPKRATTNEGKGTGIVAQIIELAEQGKSVGEIIEMGYNKSTVYRQVGEWKKRSKASTVK